MDKNFKKASARNGLFLLGLLANESPQTPKLNAIAISIYYHSGLYSKTLLLQTPYMWVIQNMEKSSWYSPKKLHLCWLTCIILEGVMHTAIEEKKHKSHPAMNPRYYINESQLFKSLVVFYYFYFYTNIFIMLLPSDNFWKAFLLGKLFMTQYYGLLCQHEDW